MSILNKIFQKSLGAWINNQSNRERWLKKTLGNIPRNSKILDAGAGELQYKRFCSHLEYTSQDFGQYDGQGNQTGLQTKTWDNSKLDIVSDITDIPVKDKAFDAIMCIEVFEHIPEPVKAVKEFSRIINKGGTLIITAPFCSITHFAPYYYANGYSPYWYKKILSENNFKVVELVPNGNYFKYLAQEVIRTPEVAQQCCLRPKSISVLEKIGILLVLKMLKGFSKKDKKSNKLLCFGYHVRAVKI